MFASAIEHIASGLNGQIRRQFSLEEDLVVISNLVNFEGVPASNINNKLIITLVSVDKDATMQAANPHFRSANEGVSRTRPLHVNLGLLVCANFSDNNYLEALKLLDASSAFFQAHPVFDHTNTPDLPSTIEKLNIDLENLSLGELSALWSMLGLKHQASLFYKVRTVVVQPNRVQARLNIVESPEIIFRPKAVKPPHE